MLIHFMNINKIGDLTRFSIVSSTYRLQALEHRWMSKNSLTDIFIKK